MAFSLHNCVYFYLFVFVYLRKRRGPSTTHTEFGNKNGGAEKHMNHARKQPHPVQKNKDMRCYRMRAWLGSKYLSFNNVFSHPHFCYRILYASYLAPSVFSSTRKSKDKSKTNSAGRRQYGFSDIKTHHFSLHFLAFVSMLNSQEPPWAFSPCRIVFTFFLFPGLEKMEGPKYDT